MAKVLTRTLYGNPILREPAKKLRASEVNSNEVQDLIANMRETLDRKKYGIGLAAPQVGKSMSLSVIRIRPTKLRPNTPKEKWADLVIINPEIIKHYGKKQQMYEGCISLPGVFAKVPRYKKVRLNYLDEKGRQQEKDFEGFIAHIIQHETDHLNGVLYVDRVSDSKSYMSEVEYRKRVVN